MLNSEYGQIRDTVSKNRLLHNDVGAPTKLNKILKYN